MDPRAVGLGYAGLVSRLAALVIDVTLLTLAGLAVTTLPSLAWQQVAGRSPGWLATSAAWLGAILPWAYFTLCWSAGGRTAGGLLLGTAVRRPGGTPVGPARAGLRALIGLLLAPVWLVGMLGVLTDGRRRAWHDRLFNTVVRYPPGSLVR